MVKKKRKSFWENYALRKIEVQEALTGDDSWHILNESKRKKLKVIRKKTYFKAGLAGALGIILLYVPYHVFGESLFPKRMVSIPFVSNEIELEIEFLIFSLAMVFIEIWYLTYVNINAVAEIAKACGFPKKKEADVEENIETLVNVSIEKKQKELKSLGINPYEGLNKIGVFAFQVLVKLKAAISSFIWKILVTKLLGRYAFRMLVDVLGAPLYACWNMWAAKKVMNEARVRVIAPSLIKQYTNLLSEEFRGNQEFQSVLYNALHSISTSKRSFHYNHFLLASSLLTKFDVELKENMDVDTDFLTKVDELSAEVQKAVGKLVLFGIMIDGSLTFIEKRSIKTLQKEKVIPYSSEQINSWSKDYFEGKGMENFFNA